MVCDSLLSNKTVVPAKFYYQLLLLPNISIFFFSVCVYTNVCAPEAGVKVLLQKVAQSMQAQATDWWSQEVNLIYLSQNQMRKVIHW